MADPGLAIRVGVALSLHGSTSLKPPGRARGSANPPSVELTKDEAISELLARDVLLRM
jgi:hypothetical protein